MRQGINVTGGLRAYSRIPHWNSGPWLGRTLDKEKEDGGLKDVHADDFFEEVALSDHAVKTNAEQGRGHKVIVIRYNGVHGSGFALYQMIKQDDQGSPHHHADSRFHDENAVVAQLNGGKPRNRKMRVIEEVSSPDQRQ